MPKISFYINSKKLMNGKLYQKNGIFINKKIPYEPFGDS